MKRLRLLFSLVIAAAAALLAVRHRSLRELEAERTGFHQQVNEATNLRSAIAQAKSISHAAAQDGLSAPERSEFLRLRGEVGMLRQELAQATNQLAKTAVRAAPVPAAALPTEAFVTQAEAMVKINHGAQWMLALMMHAEENGGRLPARLADAAKYNGSAEDGEDFELVVGGDLRSAKSPGPTIILREKKAWRSANGRWNRSYAFADGHVEIASSPTEDFTDWEAKMTARANTAPGQ